MLVYRVENAEGHGPYNYADYSTECTRLLSCAHSGRDTHPTPSTDHPSIPNTRYGEQPKVPNQFDGDYVLWLCGFKTKKEIRTWFDGFFPMLAQAGFRVAVYYVPNEFITEGGHQLTFLKQEAKLIRTFGLHTKGNLSCTATPLSLSRRYHWLYKIFSRKYKTS